MISKIKGIIRYCKSEKYSDFLLNDKYDISDAELKIWFHMS
jgi:hypothetical protein